MRTLAAFVRRINLRYWSRHRLRTGLTLLGVVTGVTLVVAIAVINSTLLSTVPDTAETLAGSADIEVASPDSTGLDTRAMKDIRALDGVAAAVPVMRTYTRIEGPENARRVLIIGTTYDFHWLFHDSATEAGALSISGTPMAKNSVFLAGDTARSLGATIGDPLRAETSTGYADLQMGGTFSGALVDALETGDLGITWLGKAQEVFNREGKVDSIYVVAEGGADVGAIEQDVTELLGRSAVVGSPGERVEGFEETLNGIAALTSLAGTVALFVAAFVVFNTMSMSIVERRKEISLTLALGATRRQVMAGFVGEAAVLGIIACLIGITAGFLLAGAMVQPGLDGLRVFGLTAVAGAELEWPHVALGIFSGVGVAVMGCYLPARRILKVAPVEALRPQSGYQDLAIDAATEGRLGIVRWALGAALLVAGVLVGPVVGSDLENATWATNLVLLMLLGGCTFLLPGAVRLAVAILRSVVPRRAGLSPRLAIDSLRRNSGRTTVTVGALVFTLGIVIGVGGALDSYHSQWERSAREWYAGPIQISSPSFISLTSDQPLPASFRDVVENVEGVRGAYPTRYRIVNIDGRQTTIYVCPYVEQLDDPTIPAEGREFRAQIASVHDDGEVVISALASKKKGVEIGDTLEVPTPTGEASFEVGGIVNDLNPLDSMYMSTGAFLDHWEDPSVDRFEVTIEDGATPAEVIGDIDRAAAEADVPVRIRTKEQLIADSFGPINQVFSVARAVQLVALIVAALAIANTMYITVIERRWELGLQRAVGMDGGTVGKTLLSEAAAIGLIGGLGAWLVGLATGYLMVKDMERSYAFSFPFEPPLDLMAITLIGGGLIALVAGAYPSRAALRTPIVEALRYE